MKKIIYLVILVLLLSLLFGCDYFSHDNNIDEGVADLEFNDSDAVRLEEEFKNALIQETEKANWLNEDSKTSNKEPINLNTRVSNFDNKEDLIEHISKITSVELAEEYVDMYYIEENGELYIIPMDGPIMIIEDEFFELVEISHGKYQLTQQVDSEFIGEYTLEITYLYDNERWIIENREVYTNS